MNRAAAWLLTAGVLLFVAVLASQGLADVLQTLSRARWGLLLVALFHLLPLLLDAIAIAVLFNGVMNGRSIGMAVLTRWGGESANSLMPAGQLGGPVLMARHLAQGGMPLPEAAAAITVSTTLQTFAQILFALAGVALLGLQAGHLSERAVRSSSLIASAVLAVQVGGFYLLQRRGIFSKAMSAVARVFGGRDWAHLLAQAQAIDVALQVTYGRAGPVAASLLFNLLGWIVGTGEVYLIARLLGSPLSWGSAFLLESLGQAIRGAGFAIPGALGVQEGGYLLLAPLAGMSPGTGLALSLAKRARELLLGLPGLLYLHLSARSAPRTASVV